ncbi:Arc family DNA-binding protein [Candidatus Neomarinimicrobiota bacterium]
MNDVKSVSFNFRMTEEIKDFLDKLAKENDRSVSYIINDLLEYFIKNPPESIPIDKKKDK